MEENNDANVTAGSLMTLKSEAALSLNQRNFQDAKTKYLHLVEQDPTDVESLTGLGQTLVELGESNQAIKTLKKAIKLSPHAPEPLHYLGRLLLTLNNFRKAVVALERAASANVGSASIWSDLGMAQKGAGDIAGSLQSLKQAIKLDPGSIFARYNLAVSLREIRRNKTALEVLDELLAANSTVIEARTLAAAILSDLGEADRAISLLKEFLATHSDNKECRQSLALIQLRAGKLTEGFENYEWRLFPGDRSVPIRPFTQNTWHGQHLETEKLLVWLEQGVGDEILSLSLLNDITKRAPHCMVECDPRLLDLLVRSFPNVRFIARRNPPDNQTSKADYACPMWSAAKLFRKQWDQFPARIGYFVPDAKLVNTIKTRYQDRANGRKMIGLSWASASAGGSLKTPPLENWKPFLDSADHFIVSLQHSPHPQDIASLNQLGQSEVYVDTAIDAADDFDLAAAQIASLDAVVSISNSTAHLAGALGVETATLIPEGFGGFWYWHRGLDQSPWYPSMRLCRQNEPGDWPTAINSVCEWLKIALD